MDGIHLVFKSLSRVFQSYWDDGGMMMNVCG